MPSYRRLWVWLFVAISALLYVYYGLTTIDYLEIPDLHGYWLTREQRGVCCSIMADESARAISFANVYFTLVDGLVPGFGEHLADRVVLDWFGKKIVGRRNVVGFLRSDRRRHRHVFLDIAPVSSIDNIKKRRRWRKTVDDEEGKCDDGTVDPSCEVQCESEESSEKTAEDPKREKSEDESDRTESDEEDAGRKVSGIDDVGKGSSEPPGLPIGSDYADTKRDESGARAITETDDESHDLNEDDLAGNPPEAKITSAAGAEELAQGTNEVKLEEEMAPTIKAINRECGQGDGSVDAEAAAIKYVEAKGKIEFTQSMRQEDPWSYHPSSFGYRCWKRWCTLQLAYSLISDNEFSLQAVASERDECGIDANVQSDVPTRPSTSKLPDLEEILRTSDKLVPNVDNFGGYLKTLNFSEDRDQFLRDLETEIKSKNPDKRVPIVRYIGEKLNFEMPANDGADSEKLRRKRWCKLNYRIHTIIYKAVVKSKEKEE